MRNEKDTGKKEDEARQLFFFNPLPPPMKTDTENRMAKPKAYRRHLQQNYGIRYPQELQKMSRCG